MESKKTNQFINWRKLRETAEHSTYQDGDLRVAWTHGEIAKRIGVTRQSVTEILRGRSGSIGTLHQICALFGVKYKDYLLDDPMP